MPDYDAIMIGVGTVRIKILPQYMEALRADERVGF